MKKIEILKRLYKDYTKKYLNKIILSSVFSIIVAGSTSAIAWLLDPAIKKIFIDKDQSLLLFIPILIILAFSSKGISLYIAKVLMIQVGEEVKKKLQYDMLRSLVNADTQFIDQKHSGTFISNRIAYHISSSLNWGLAAALATILLIAVLFLYYAYDKIVGIDNVKLG